MVKTGLLLILIVFSWGLFAVLFWAFYQPSNPCQPEIYGTENCKVLMMNEHKTIVECDLVH